MKELSYREAKTHYMSYKIPFIDVSSWKMIECLL